MNEKIIRDQRNEIFRIRAALSKAQTSVTMMRDSWQQSQPQVVRNLDYRNIVRREDTIPFDDADLQ